MINQLHIYTYISKLRDVIYYMYSYIHVHVHLNGGKELLEIMMHIFFHEPDKFNKYSSYTS